MVEFLTFDRFISIDMLILFYYLGAFVLPLLLYFSRAYFFQRYPFTENLMQSLNNSASVRMKVIFLLCIIFCEIIWRMMFEAMIGYFQMHEYLQHLQR
ncbi:MAG: DUF4282 domain-containing protein [Thiovulaceae bacterium]|nr:DUF4282 domain-containing protein [Sulfurimonadaceae bacterium]